MCKTTNNKAGEAATSFRRTGRSAATLVGRSPAVLHFRERGFLREPG